MNSKSGHTKIVRGVHHHLKFVNGWQVYGWTSAPIKRGDAIKRLMENTNGNQNIYTSSDVESYWTTKN